MTRTRYFMAAAVAVLALASSRHAFAVEGGLSPYPKGFAGFMSGLVPPDQGLYLTDDYYHFHGSADRDVRGGIAEFGVGATLDADFLAATYVTDLHALGATYAVGGALAYAGVGLHATIDAPNSGIDVHLNQSGIADSLILPVILGWNDGNWHYNFNVSIYVPTGEYSKGELSVGKNIWAFMPAFAVTWYDPKSGWEASSSFTFVTQTFNGATDYQSGDIVHWDWGAGWHFGAHQAWEIGVQGNLVEQITGDSGSGAVLGPLKAESAGLGPAISYSTMVGKTPMSFSAKWEGDFEHRNTFGGDLIMVSATAVF
jgi:hypothetical protein